MNEATREKNQILTGDAESFEFGDYRLDLARSALFNNHRRIRVIRKQKRSVDQRAYTYYLQDRYHWSQRSGTGTGRNS